MDALGTALRYHAAGLSVFSRPYGAKFGMEHWAHWQTQPPSEMEVRQMFGNGPANTAIAYGPASGNLIGLDCDSARRYAEALAMVNGLGISTWIVRRPEVEGDSHNGGGTFFFRTRERAQGRNMTDLDVKTAGYSLVPLSRHPGGVDYYTEAGSPERILTLPSLDTLAPWIELRPWAPVPGLRELEERLPKRGDMPRRARSLLAGDVGVLSQYDTRSEAEQGCLCSLINAGYDFGSCYSFFCSSEAMEKFQEKRTRNPREAIDWLELSYRKAAAHVLNNLSEAWRLAHSLRQWSESRPWPGAAGATDHAIYSAHVSIVERCNRQPHGASCRELAELAGTSLKTASKANHRLLESGLLRLEQAATLTRPNRFSLVDVRENVKGNTPSLYPVRECYPMLVQHDAFRWSGLNKSGAEVWAQLLWYTEATDSELAEATGRHISTVKSKLGTMFQVGMVEPLGDTLWRALPEVDLDAVAEILGTAGIGERQKREHQRQREARQWALNVESLPCSD